MIPAFAPGDHVLAFGWSKIKVGDVIAYRGDKNYIKRIDKIDKSLYYVSGDNKRESAKMSPVKKEQIVGKIIFKY